MKRCFSPVVLVILFFAFSGNGFADSVTLTGFVSTFGPNGTNCASSAQSSGPGASINLDCALGDGETFAHVSGDASSVVGYGESGALGTGGVYSWSLAVIENFTFKSASNVCVQIDAFGGFEPSVFYSFSFAGNSFSGGSPTSNCFSFAVQPGTYTLLLNASAENGGTNGNSVFDSFDYAVSSSAIPSVSEPSSFALLLPGVLMVSAKIRRSIRH